MLTGTMGELRATHFHAGLDINTPTIGQPVYAANDGYIYRVTITTGGYGTVMYIRHPDGKATLYAHLNELKGPVADFVLQERYRRKQSEIDLNFAPNQFPVRKGMLIAKSGNTGGSGGPHLHFELRSERDEALNPMTLGYSEIQDDTPPLPQRIAFRALTIDSRVNQQFGRFEYHLQKKGKDFFVTQPIDANGWVGVEILAHDKQSNSTFRFGISQIEMFANGDKVFRQKIDRINFSESRNILALLDYRTMEARGVRFNKLYIDDGNRLDFYAGTTARKGIQVTNEDVRLEIKLTDFHGNATSVFATLRAAMIERETMTDVGARPIVADVTGSVLTLNVGHCRPVDESATGETVQLFEHGAVSTVSPAYSGGGRHVYLIDLRRAQPDSIATCNGTWISNFKDRVPPATSYKYYGDWAEVEFQPYSLYDTLHLTTSYDSTIYETFTIGSRSTPLQHSVKIQLKPWRTYTATKSLGVYRVDGGGKTYMGNNWKNGKVTFQSQSLGQFAIMYDSMAPSVRPITVNRGIARLRIRDELSGISYFEASINGQWLLMTYDYKTGVVYSEKLDESVPLRGDFELKVVDNAGNETLYKQRIP